MMKSFLKLFSFAAVFFVCAGLFAEPLPYDVGDGLGYRIRFAGSYKYRENAFIVSFIVNYGDISKTNGTVNYVVQKNDTISFKVPNKPVKIKITDIKDNYIEAEEIEDTTLLEEKKNSAD